MLLWHRKAVVLKCEHIASDRLTDVHDGRLPALALRHAAGKTRALGHPEAVFTGIDDYLSQRTGLRGGWENINQVIFGITKYSVHRLRLMASN